MSREGETKQSDCEKLKKSLRKSKKRRKILHPPKRGKSPESGRILKKFENPES